MLAYCWITLFITVLELVCVKVVKFIYITIYNYIRLISRMKGVLLLILLVLKWQRTAANTRSGMMAYIGLDFFNEKSGAK